ncbi:MAG: PKD domain-containing protein [Salinivirgaceae bacterium]|nr:PKD domain-containing protein [Salinivirgaceae bacterium]
MKKITHFFDCSNQIKKSFNIVVFLLVAISIQAQIVPTNQYDLPGYPNVEAYYPFEKNSFDYSGNNNDLVILNAIPVIGRNGGEFAAYEFNGFNSALKDAGGYDWLQNNQFAMSMWVKTQTIVDTSVLLMQLFPSNDIWFGLKNDRFTFSKNDGGSTTYTWVSTESILPDQWYMLSANYIIGAPDTVELFINGVKSSFTQEPNMDYFSPYLSLRHVYGAADSLGTSGFTGVIDEVKIFSYALDSAQMIDMYNHEVSNLRDITFKVDMNYQIGIGKFDTGTDFVDVPGTFNGWAGGEQMVHEGGGYYTLTLNSQYITDSLQFKFRINGDPGNEEFQGGAYRSWVVEDRINNLSYLYNDEEYTNNLAIVSVNQPNAMSSGSADSVEVTVKNLGYNVIEGFDLSLEFDGGLPFTEFRAVTLNFGDSYTHTFDTTIDVSAQGIHVLKVSCYSSGDEQPLDDTVYYTISNLSVESTYPYYQDFESAGHGWFSGGKNSSWERGTPTKSVINSAHSGSNAFVTGLSSTVAPGEESFLISPRFQGPFTNTAVEFSYFCHSNWQAGAAIQYSSDGGVSWMRLADNWTVPNGNEDDVPALGWTGDMAGFVGFYNYWKTVRYDLGDLGGASEVVFRVAFGSEEVLDLSSDGFAFDDFKFYEKLNTDLSIVSAKTEDNLNANFDEYVFVSVLNYGNLDINNWHIEAHLDNAEVFTNDFIGYSIFPGDVVGESVEINLTNLADGPYNLTIIAYADGDENESNDTLVISGVKMPTITAFPFTDDFESTILWNVYNDDFDEDKLIEFGSASGDYIYGVYAGSNAMATNVIGNGGFRTTAVAVSPWFNFSGMFRPSIEFAMFRELTAADQNAMGIQCRTRQSGWQQLGVVDQNWYNNYLDGSFEIYNKGQYEGWSNIVDGDWMIASSSFPEIADIDEVQFKILYSVGDNWSGSDGFAIDNFQVFDNPFSDDLALIKIESPSTGLGQANDTVRVLIQNQGINPATGFDISFSYDTVFLSETVLNNILPGEIYEHTFTQTIDLSIEGEYSVDAEITYVADVNTSNNILSKGVNILPFLSTPPYAFDFESGPQGWVTGSLGIAAMGSFQHGMPSGQTINTGAGGSMYAFATNAFYFADELSYVQSPFFDLSSFVAPKVSLNVWAQMMDADDGAALQYTKDNGASWITIGVENSVMGWYNMTANPSQGGLAKIGIMNYWTHEMWAWQYAEHSIAELAGEPSVSFRIIFGSDNGDNDYDGFAFDNFSIQESLLGLTENFNDNVLTNWDSEPTYTLNEIAGELEITATNKIDWEAFNYNVNMSIADNPYLAVRLKSDSAITVRFAYVDVFGTWTDYGNGGFQIPGDGLYHDYYWDFTNKLKNWEHTQVDANQITQVAVQVNQGQAEPFSGLIYMDDLRLGSDAKLSDNIKLFWTEVGNGCHDTPTPVEFRMVNTGMNPAFDLEMSYSVDGVLMATETITDTVYPGDTLIYVFTQMVDLSAGGTDYIQYYLFETNVGCAVDENPSDNSQSFNYAVYNSSYVEKPGWMSYNICDGLADNYVWAIDKDTNGDIWMSGFKGVTRYTGTEFIQYHEEDGLAADYSWTIQAASDGTVWFPATTGGFTSYKNGVFTKHFELGTLLFEECSFEDATGNMWFGSYSGNGIAMYNGSTWTQYLEAGGIIEDIDQASNGDMLFANQGSVMSFDGTNFTEFLIDSESVYVNEIFRDSYNTIWFYGSDKLKRYDGTNFTDFSADVAAIGYIQAIEEDADGNIWFGGANGAAMFNDMNWIIIYSGYGLIPSKVWSIVGADDGTVWLGTEKGLSQFTKGPTILVQYDMNYMISSGFFDPANDYVDLAGTFNEWSGVGLKDQDNDKIYEALIYGFSIGDTIEYKARVNGDWCDYHEFQFLQNRQFVVESESDTLFHIFNDDINPIFRTINFSIDLNKEFYLGLFNPVNDSLFLEASVNCGINALMEDVDANLIYTVQVDSAFFTDGVMLPYKFIINQNIYEPIGVRFLEITDSALHEVSNIWNDDVNPIADFMFYSSDLTVEFYNYSFALTDTAEFFWSFGNGKSSTVFEPIHTYNNPGEYQVCLQVTDEAGNSNEFCQLIEVLGDTTISSCLAKFDFLISTDTLFLTNNSSENITNFFWDFGDNTFSNEENPTHVYLDGGYYDVTLTAYDSITECLNSIVKQVLIEIGEPVCYADFVYQNDFLTVNFSSNVEGDPDTYYWAFGDGNYSMEINPSHTYKFDGFYDVCLTIYSDSTNCFDEVCKLVEVQSDTIANCFADFDYIINGADVEFVSNSYGHITNHFWNFDDGFTDTITNPSHSYLNSGYYDVSLTVFDSTSNCLSTTSKFIFIIVPEDTTITCQAKFGFVVNENTVVFNNNSTLNNGVYFWYFGDGSYSEKKNPTHIYKKAKYYEVCLAIYDTVSECYDEICKIIPVTNIGAPTCNASFDYFVDGLDVNFNGMALGNVTDYFWHFGDGAYGYDSVMQHTYSKSGYYEVNFTIFNDVNNCVDDYSSVVFVYDSTANSCNAKFTSFTNLKKVTFADKSEGNVTDYFWYFDDGTFSTEESPVHNYSKSGFYEVELTVYSSSSNCIDSYYKVVQVIDTTESYCQAGYSYYTNIKTVTFTDESIGNITDYFWDFGDGYYSTDYAASHTYTDPGYYEVIQTVYNSNTECLDEYFDVVVVFDDSANLCKSNFTYYPTGLNVSFTSQATGAYEQHFWDFDDGKNSNKINPAHTFENPGYYEVAYSVVDTAKECFDTRYKVIFVEGTGGGSTSDELKPKFSNITTPNTFSVNFKDESLGDVSSWYWDFGNNTPAVVLQNPVYVYDTNDYYRVCLTISNTDNQETKCKFIAVGDVSNSSTAFFNYFADSLTSTAHFKNKSLGNIVDHYWDFGDGYDSHQKDPSHSYADTGYYAVCLTTKSATNVFKTYCKDVNIGNTIENPCLFSCVWPGDANNDLEANHYDIMTIGLNYGMEGPKREDATLNWYGQFAQSWSTFQIDGTNNKHGDCNGDGVINSADTLAITENFASSHTYQPDAKIKNPQWLISCVWDSIIDDKAAGSRRGAKAQLSPPAKNKEGELYAIAYEIEVIGGEKIIWKTSYVSFANSWIGEDDVSMLTVAQMDSNRHIIYIGSTRIDQQNVSGSGEIATLNFEFKAGIDPTGVSFNVTTLGGIVSTGEAVTVDGSIELMFESPIEICKGDVAILDAGEGFDTYIWSTGAIDTSRIEVTTAGYYGVTVSDSTGTIASDSIEVIVNELPLIDLGADVFQDDSLTLDAGAGFVSYDWSTGSTEQTITVTETGEYWVVVTNNKGCSASDTVTITITGIYDNISKNIAVYPNPNNGKFWLVYEFNSTTHPVVEIINITGETVWRNEKMDHVGHKNLIEIDNLNKGIYYVKVLDGEKMGTLRFVVL